MTARKLWIGIIVLGVAAWGAFHALGAYRYNHDPRRAAMVLACVGGYLAFWMALLTWRKFARRVKSTSRHRDRSQSSNDDI